MKYGKKPAALFLLALFVFCIHGLAEQKKQVKHSAYYNQKKTLFDQLPNTKGEIIFLGDSITDGCEWSEVFHDLRIKNRGISGDITQGILDRLDEVLESQPAKIFLMIGINDLAWGFSVSDILANYKKILMRIIKESPRTKTYIQSLLPVNSDFGTFRDHTNKSDEVLYINKRLKKTAGELDMVYVDLYSHFVVKGQKLNPEYTNDGLHLTGKGYEVWKTIVEKYVKE
jgi:lysophospholipase L1-like esterase